MAEIKNTSPLISQTILRILGQYCSTYLGNDLYYLINVIYLLISDLDENILKKEWELKGKNYKWDDMMKTLERTHKIVIETKSWYDSIENKRFDNKQKDKEIRKFYFNTASKIPIIQPKIYELFIFLVNHSSIQRLTISPDAFKIIEHRNFRTLDMTRGKMTGMPSSYPMSFPNIIQESQKDGTN